MKRVGKWNRSTTYRLTLIVTMICASLLWFTADVFAADSEAQPGATITPPAPPLGPRPGPPPGLLPPVANPQGFPQGVNCPPGTTWLSGQCAPIGPPPAITTEKGPPPAINCPPGKVSLFGQCVPISLPGVLQR
jgi:hypothetical protein